MPGRKKLRKEIYRTKFDEIERNADLLDRAMPHASIGMSQSTACGEAMMQLRKYSAQCCSGPVLCSTSP